MGLGLAPSVVFPAVDAGLQSWCASFASCTRTPSCSAAPQLGSFDTGLRDGWGLTNDGRFLIATDNTHTVSWIDPEMFKVVKTLHIMDGDTPVHWLNEVGACVGREGIRGNGHTGMEGGGDIGARTGAAIATTVMTS